MVKHGIHAALAFNFVALMGPAVHGQSRTAALNVQVQVRPSCAISVVASGEAPRARLSCAGSPQSTLRTRVDDGPVSPVRLASEGQARSAAEVAVPGSPATRVLTIQF